MFDLLKKAPFNLDGAALDWVQTTFASLDNDEKLAQLIVLQSMGFDDRALTQPQDLKVGGITRFFTGDFETEKKVIADMQHGSKVPMLISADLEGSIMSLPFGTEVPNPLALAAVDDLADTKTVSEIMAQEARAIGINWSFTPVLDVSAAFRSAIVATRSYGSEPERIKRHAVAQLETFQSSGIAATVKHWPGEGYDDRDQHLVTTEIPQTVEAWRDTSGMLYSAAIEAGTLAVMSAHVSFPDYVRSVDPDADVLTQHRPAVISKHLNETLLRDELGFNGLIVSDATPMAGLSTFSPRPEHLPEVIENGCDMILFCDDPEGDLDILKDALAAGTLSQARVDAAVIRVLGLKAAVGLHEAPIANEMPDQKVTATTVAPIMQKAPTLVKDVQDLMPLDPSKHKRIYMFSTGLVSPLMGGRELSLADMLRKEGFEVTIHDPTEPGMRKWDGYDLVLYALAEETLLTRGNIFLDWARLTGFFGAAMERPWHEVPCALISFGFPYYLYDAPRMPCVINAYMAADIAQKAVVECLMGRAPFEGQSPVDPFCGQEIARY